LSPEFEEEDGEGVGDVALPVLVLVFVVVVHGQRVLLAHALHPLRTILLNHQHSSHS
jgi:hypothetical protein